MTDSIKSGVTYSIASGNANVSLDTIGVTPAEIGPYALVAGAENPNNDYRWVDATPTPTPLGSDYGSRLALFSPGYAIPSADAGSDTATNSSRGTSRASAAVAGVAALYLQGRTGMNDCGNHPITGQSSSTTGASISTCPDRVNQFIMANSTLNRLATSGSGAIGTGSPNRLLFTGNISTTTNFSPIDNQRFYVWQQYVDFFAKDYDLNWPTTDHLRPKAPDEDGLDWWTNEIIAHDHNCNAGVNDNNSCTNTWRINTSRAFWVDQHASLFTSSYGLQSGKNAEFVQLCYSIYLQRTYDPNDTGYQGWLNDLTNNYGNPANADGVRHLIDAFINSTEYRQRFGGS